MSEPTYKIVRFFRDNPRKNFTLRTGLTLAEAQEHCSDPETSSSTCTFDDGKIRTAHNGPWFEGFTKEG